MTAVKPLRFIHTADWQLGLRVRFIPGDAGAVVREARLETIRRIGAVAKENEAEFVVVAGDVFEHHGLKPATLRKTFDVLKEFTVPVYLLPGNHDPYTSDALYLSKRWKKECPRNVHVLGSAEPVQVRDGVTLLPCPLLDRHTLEDPTNHLQSDFGPQAGFRIGVAHGGIREFLEGMGDEQYELKNAISKDACSRGRLDYLALGDWHGYLKIDERTYYSGAPEATRFKEKEPGNVLLVEVAEPGGPAVVQRVEVNTLRWIQKEFTVSAGEDLAALEKFVEELLQKTETLLELFLEGTVDASLRHRLQTEVLDKTADRLCWLRVRDEKLHTLVNESDLEEIAKEGWVRDVIDSLRGDLSGVSRGEADGALRLLYRLHMGTGK